MRLQPCHYAFSACIHLVMLLALSFLPAARAVRREVVVIDFNLENIPHQRVSSQPAPSAPSHSATPQTLPLPVRQSVAPPAEPVSALPDNTVPSKPVAAGPQVQVTAPSNEGSAVSGGGGAVQTVHGPQGASPVASSAGSRPDNPSDGEQGRKRYLKEHFSYIHDLIAKRLAYPSIARKMGWSGKVVLAFVVNEDGGVGSISVRQGSGYSVLDRSAIETVRSSAPFPRPPVAAEIVMPVLFRLQ